MRPRKTAKLYILSSCLILGPGLIQAKSQPLIRSSIDGEKALRTSLTPHHQVIKDLIVTQEEKDAVLLNIDNILSEKNKAIFEYMKLTESLKSKINKLTFTDKIKSEFKKRDISSKIDRADHDVNELQKVITKKNLKIESLQKKITNQNIHFTNTIHKLNYRIKSLSDSLNNNSQNIEKDSYITASIHAEKIRSLHNEIHTKSTSLENIQKNIAQKAGFEEITIKNRSLALELKQAKEELEKYRVSYIKLKSSFKTQAVEISKLEAYTDNIKSKYLTHIKALENSSVKKRSPASIPEQTEDYNTNLGFFVDIAPQHLKIILDEKFFFKRGLTKLEKEAEERLQAIMNTYSQKIFSSEKLKDRLKHIHITGHSSPIYRGKFVNPNDASNSAYQLNMDISINRAKSIAHTIIDKNTDLENKSEIRSKLVVSGYSFSRPMPLSRAPASLVKSKCGVYDCSKSQRVEIVFELEKEK